MKSTISICMSGMIAGLLLHCGASSSTSGACVPAEERPSSRVSAQRLNHRTNFQYDGVTAFMQVSIGQRDEPMLGVYEVYSVCSGDLSLPYTVER